MAFLVLRERNKLSTKCQHNLRQTQIDVDERQLPTPVAMPASITSLLSTPTHPAFSHAHRTKPVCLLTHSPVLQTHPSFFYPSFSSTHPYSVPPPTNRSLDANTLITGFTEHVIVRHIEVNFSSHFFFSSLFCITRKSSFFSLSRLSPVARFPHRPPPP
ncbi:unnamed protein product [Acanthosepion pharaonis]|uniref:Uncharacterized protein n=1 Tax=Acanthosepion pharaonis TaxID=158019 RepID=A0A812ASA7_ACAPH|nr:unnamed protein product [Sepia pharaonis]